LTAFAVQIDELMPRYKLVFCPIVDSQTTDMSVIVHIIVLMVVLNRASTVHLWTEVCRSTSSTLTWSPLMVLSLTGWHTMSTGLTLALSVWRCLM